MMKDLAMIAQLMKGRNPQEVAMQMIKNQKNIDPAVSQLIEFAQTGNTNAFENLASSIFQQNGMDMNEEVSALMSLLKQ